MPMSVVYTTVNGQILCENRGGVVSHFVSDPLGSVVMVRDNAGNTVYEAEYAPYGNVQSETGTNPSEFGYVGTLGYVKDSAFSLYVRARYLLTNLGRWLTKDPQWPNEPGFVYAGAAPSIWADPFGMSLVVISPSIIAQLIQLVGPIVAAQILAILAVIAEFLDIALLIALVFLILAAVALGCVALAIRKQELKDSGFSCTKKDKKGRTPKTCEEILAKYNLGLEMLAVRIAEQLFCHPSVDLITHAQPIYETATAIRNCACLAKEPSPGCPPCPWLKGAMIRC